MKTIVCFFFYLFLNKAVSAQTIPYVVISPRSNAYGVKMTAASPIRANGKVTGISVSIKNTSNTEITNFDYRVYYYDRNRRQIADTTIVCDPDAGSIRHVVKNWIVLPQVDENGQITGNDSFPSLEDEEAIRREVAKDVGFAPGRSSKVKLHHWPARAAYAIVSVRSVNIGMTTYYSSGY